MTSVSAEVRSTGAGVPVITMPLSLLCGADAVQSAFSFSSGELLSMPA